MRERVELLGGQFVLHSSPGGGTLIQITIPVAPAGD
jgi:signal transduction histidine kinase